ncbi:MAG TPA: beta-ketoacyl-[acyl-carrier-protein] synthase family protein [Polyangiaceae bacterium]|jgi:3-oxoacyl-[acyl-carrier-protein] synthase-1|nr:beta-ketoacyl-[acyl-carrier-protein] synthase family protein [Polyangiaceae bacterium]
MGDRALDVVVTGVGVCCNMGDDTAEILGRLRNGRNVPFERWQTAVELQARCQVIGQYHGDVTDAGLGLPKKLSRFMGRGSRLALRATQIATAQAGLFEAPLPHLEKREVAVVYGAGTGDVETHIEVRRKLDETHDAKRVVPTVIPKLMASTVSANLVNVLRTTGPSFTATAACAGGAYNILLACQLIQSGHVRAAISGGVEVCDPHFFAGFDAMGAYNGRDNDHPERASRPYAADRAGFIFSEGSGTVVLERRDDAEKRGAKILGVIRGFGMSSDGQGEMVAPAASGAANAMRIACSTSGIGTELIDYVNTHGTSTPLGDISEVKAIRDVFGGRHVHYSSTKGYTGHTISAAGVIEAIFTLAMLEGGWVAPSVHATPLDPELEAYPPVVAPLDAKLRYAMSNSFGFGGTNASLLLSAS